MNSTRLLLLSLVCSLAAGAAGAAEGDAPKVPLKLQLPPPLFVGTPVPAKLANLETPRSGPRPLFMVPAGVVNLARDKAVTSSDMEPLLGDLPQITDGEKEGEEGYYVELGRGKQWVQIDLGASHAIHAIVVWHFHSSARVYKQVVVQLSDDPDFVTGVTTVFNNDLDNESGLGAGKDPTYVETNEGRLIDAKVTTARYVRLYSTGSTSSAMNHYIEVEVHGLP